MSNSKPIKRTHPALDFTTDTAMVGIVDEQGMTWRIDSDRQQLSLQDLQEHGLLTTPLIPYDGIHGRWDEDDLQKFLNGSEGPTAGATMKDIMGVLTHYLELSRPDEAALVACWIVGTYVYPLFPAYPRLDVHGERGSGKSKLLQLIARLAFNGLHRVQPTPATLYRLIGPLRPTFCLDEMEGLSGIDSRDISGIINSGYKDGGYVDRTEGDASNRRPVRFAVYTPMALAGIKGLNDTIRDRSITITMVKSVDGEKVNRELPLEAEDIAASMLRAGCYRLALTQFQSIKAVRAGLDLPHWLMGRHRELYAPLVAITTVADPDGSLGLRQAILALAKTELGERGGMSTDGEALFQVLAQQLGPKDEYTARPGELATLLTDHLDQRVSAEGVAALLRRYGFKPDKKDRAGVPYPITRDMLTAATARYGYVGDCDGVTVL